MAHYLEQPFWYFRKHNATYTLELANYAKVPVVTDIKTTTKPLLRGELCSDKLAKQITLFIQRISSTCNEEISSLSKARDFAVNVFAAAQFGVPKMINALAQMPNVDLLGVAKGDIITVTIEEDEYTLYVTSQHSNAIQAVILDSENSGKYNTYQSLFICDN